MSNKTEYDVKYMKEHIESVRITYQKDSEISDIIQNITVYCRTQGLSRNQFILNAIIKEWERIDKE